MKRFFVFALVLLLAVSVCSCKNNDSVSSQGSFVPSQSAPETTVPKAESLLAEMTLEEKIAQLFIVEPSALLKNSTNTAVGKSDAERLANSTVGGFVLFANNIQNPAQITAYINALKNCKTTPFIAIDEEGGRVARIANNSNFKVTKYSSMLSLGGDTEKAYSVGATIGAYLKEYGFSLDFAPVADVFTNPANTVIGNRAFSTDPEVAAEMVAACIGGLHSKGVIPCAKHFPGHGDTAEDSHFGLATTNKSWQELMECEMLPFISAIEADCDMIMVGHISAPAVTGDNTPATLSRILITEKLREELGFEGVVVTDSMQMQGITDKYGSATAAVMAIKAGVDIILMPQDFNEATEGIKLAVQSGEITEGRINESVLRILELKEKYGLIK